ncbi:MAG: hypothetical protein KC620_06085 [Myxococcales bacterium]|nr:hypothetical protein [Myxococcales bacterium]
MRRGVARAAVLSLLLAGTGQAQTGETVAQVEELAREARTLYEAGDFGRAVSVYLEAYKLQPTAAVLYNVAVIYDRKLNETDLAADFYRRYIRSPDADPEAVLRATKRLQELKADQEARRAADMATLGNNNDGADPMPNRVDTGIRPTGTSGQVVAGWSLIGLGAAGLATGGVFGYLARDAANEFEGTIVLEDKKDLRDTAKSRALIADIAFGVGAAAAVTGVVLLLLDDGGAEASALRFGPTPGGAQVGLGGVF